MMLSQLTKSFIGPDVEVKGLTCDSRAVQPGMLFAALPGTQVDGRKYIPDAISKGAVAILAEPGAKIDVTSVETDNPRLDYSHLARKFYPGQPPILVAMTGTNGKSSTVEFLRQIWAYTGLKSACFGTLGVRLENEELPLGHTTPDAVKLHQTLQLLSDKQVTHVGMEASSHGLKQYRMHSVDISAAGFSNLTQDHFDYHPDMDDYFNAKATLFMELTPSTAPVVINVDDEYGRRLSAMCSKRGQKVITVGWAGEHIRIDEVMPKAASQLLDIIIGASRYKVELPLVGEFQVLNAISALGLAIETGVPEKLAIEALGHLTGVAGRLELAGKTPQGAPVLIDFAHTEDGLDKLLRSVRPHTMGRLIIVFGCGGDRDPLKRPKMGAMAQKHADYVIVTDDNPRSESPADIRRQVLLGCPGAEEIGDRAKAIGRAVEMLQSGDCLIIAGKGHERGQILADKTIPFSDLEVARLALEGISA